MAQKIVYVDDIDGTEDAESQTFSVNSDVWEIDLSDDNAQKLHAALAPFIEHARKVGKSTTPKRASRAKGASKAIREWAVANGHEVPSRGRIPQTVVDAYNAR